MKELIEKMWGEVEKKFNENGMVENWAIMIHDNRSIYYSLPSDRNEFIQAMDSIHKIAMIINPDLIIHVSESWIVTRDNDEIKRDISPSEDSDRKEAVVMCCIFPSGVSSTYIGLIHRPLAMNPYLEIKHENIPGKSFRIPGWAYVN